MESHHYYYAADEKVPIVLDRAHIAVDFARLLDASPKLGQWSEVHRTSKPLRGELRLVDREDIPDDLYAELDEKSALYPVYLYEDALIIVLPEVRVEGNRAQQARVRDLVKTGPVRAAVEPREGGRLVLRPISGRGEDAITLANSVHERVRPSMAEARFVRVVPSPALSRG